MNLDYLRTYREVIKLGSFSKAAKKLSISQPAVSFQIQALERDLGIRLIDRGRKTITLTEAGKRLLDFADLTEQERERLAHDLSQLHDEITGELAISRRDNRRAGNRRQHHAGRSSPAANTL